MAEQLVAGGLRVVESRFGLVERVEMGAVFRADLMDSRILGRVLRQRVDAGEQMLLLRHRGGRADGLCVRVIIRDDRASFIGGGTVRRRDRALREAGARFRHSYRIHSIQLQSD